MALYIDGKKVIGTNPSWTFSLRPVADNIYDIGTATYSYRNAHFQTAVYATSVVGNWSPSGDDTYWLGTSSLGWKGLHMPDTLVTDDTGYVLLRNNANNAYVGLKVGAIEVQSVTTGISLAGTYTTGISITDTACTDGISVGVMNTGDLIRTSAKPRSMEIFSKIATTEDTTTTLRGLWSRFRVDAGVQVGSVGGWGEGIDAIEGSIKFYGGTTTDIYCWQTAGVWAMLECDNTSAINFQTGTHPCALFAHIELGQNTDLKTGSAAAAVVAFSNSHVSVTTTGTYDGVLVDKESGKLSFDAGLRITDSVAGIGIAIGTVTTGIDFTGTLTGGINFSSATLTPDSSRTNYAYSMGNRAGELTINLDNANSQNLELFQANVNLTCTSGAPTSTSTVCLIRARSTHDTTDMPNLRLRSVNTYMDVRKNLQDAYGCIHGIDFYTNAVTVGGEAAVGVFNMECNSAVTGDVRGLIVNVYGAGTPSTTSIGVEVRSDGGSATLAEGIRIWSVGGNSITTGVLFNGTVTTGLDLSAATMTTGIKLGSCTTGIDFTGTVTKGINFANATVTVDNGRDNAFWSIGTYGSPVTISVSDNFLATQINLVNDAEVLSAAKKLDCLYLNATTGANQGTYGRLKGLESYVVIKHALKDAHAIYGEVYYDASVTGITNEGCGVGGTVDTTGCSSAPAGLLYGGKFRIKGTLDTGTYKHMALYVVGESSTHSIAVIEDLSGATVTNMLWLKGEATAGAAIKISGGGTITNDIVFQDGSTLTDDGTTLTLVGAGFLIGDDELLRVGTTGDGVLVNISAGLASNTGLANVLIGTPVSPSSTANSVYFSNITADSDILFCVNDGGTSKCILKLDGSSGIFAFPTSGRFESTFDFWGRMTGSDAATFVMGTGLDILMQYQDDDADAKCWAFVIDESTDSGNNVPVFVFGEHTNIWGANLGLFDAFVEPLVTVVDNDADSYFGITFSADDQASLLANNALGIALPAGKFGVAALNPSVTTRGQFYFTEGGAGVADLLYCVMKGADNNYTAIQVAVG